MNDRRFRFRNGDCRSRPEIFFAEVYNWHRARTGGLDDCSALGLSEVTRFSNGPRFKRNGLFDNVVVLVESNEPAHLELNAFGKMRQCGCQLVPGQFMTNPRYLGRFRLQLITREVSYGKLAILISNIISRLVG